MFLRYLSNSQTFKKIYPYLLAQSHQIASYYQGHIHDMHLDVFLDVDRYQQSEKNLKIIKEKRIVSTTPSAMKTIHFTFLKNQYSVLFFGVLMWKHN